MLTLEIPVKVAEAESDADLNNTEVAPWFYWVPCPGVRYYTYDYRPALEKRIRHWAKNAEGEKTD